MITAKLREERIDPIKMVESIEVQLTDNFLTLFKFYKLGDDTKSEMIMLTRKEAQELYKFLQMEL